MEGRQKAGWVGGTHGEPVVQRHGCRRLAAGVGAPAAHLHRTLAPPSLPCSSGATTTQGSSREGRPLDAAGGGAPSRCAADSCLPPAAPKVPALLHSAAVSRLDDRKLPSPTGPDARPSAPARSRHAWRSERSCVRLAKLPGACRPSMLPRSLELPPDPPPDPEAGCIEARTESSLTREDSQPCSCARGNGHHAAHHHCGSLRADGGGPASSRSASEGPGACTGVRRCLSGRTLRDAEDRARC